MEKYDIECMNYLQEQDPKLLIKYLNNAKEPEKKQTITSSAFVCKNCNKRTVSYVEKQSRSADEGASIYYSCNSCKYIWYDK